MRIRGKSLIMFRHAYIYALSYCLWNVYLPSLRKHSNTTIICTILHKANRDPITQWIERHSFIINWLGGGVQEVEYYYWLWDSPVWTTLLDISVAGQEHRPSGLQSVQGSSSSVGESAGAWGCSIVAPAFLATTEPHFLPLAQIFLCERILFPWCPSLYPVYWSSNVGAPPDWANSVSQ